MKNRILGASVLLALGGCAFGPLHVISRTPTQLAASTTRVGSVVLEGQLHGARTVQYLSTDINSMKVSILDAGNSNSLVASNLYTGASLSSHLVSGAFSFLVNNLKVNDGTHPSGYSYNATVDAYLDSAGTTLIGSTTTAAPFSLTAGQTLSVSFPSLGLIATPVGNATATGSSAVTIVDNPPPAVTFN